MGNDKMRPAYNFETKYRVIMSTSEEWTKEPRVHPTGKEPVWYTDRSRQQNRTGAGVFGQSLGKRLSICLSRYTTVVKAEDIYAILACLYDIQQITRSEKTLVFVLIVK
jgi:hypothetical protein